MKHAYKRNRACASLLRTTPSVSIQLIIHLKSTLLVDFIIFEERENYEPMKIRLLEDKTMMLEIILNSNAALIK